jgi:hypothetical protein
MAMRKLMLFLMCLMVVAGSASAVIVNFDFQTWAGSVPASTTYTGQGALEDRGNNYWNAGGSGWANFTMNNMLASDGVTSTTIDFASTITKFFDGSTFPLINALMRDYKFIDNTVGWNPGTLTFSGLTPNGAYRFYLYAAGNAEGKGSKFTCNGVTKETSGVAFSDQFIMNENYVILDTVAGPADANGVGNVVMTWDLRTGATQAVLNGFQIQPLDLKRGQAHTPVPVEFAAVFVPSTPSISWYSPEQDKNGVVVDDPNLTVTGYDVWLGTQEPNDVTGTPISTNQPGQSKTVSLAYGSTYYWRIDTHVAWDSNSITGNFTDLVKGRVWKFTTRPSYIAPTITTFNSVITTQPILPAALSATVANNTETISSVTFTLQTGDVFYPAGAIATLTNTTTNKQNPTATLTADKPGTYKVNLAVFDGVNTVNKLAEVVIYTDACAAKKASPSGWTANYYDRNANCFVQLSDFVPLAVAWLNDTSLTAQMLY